MHYNLLMAHLAEHRDYTRRNDHWAESAVPVADPEALWDRLVKCINDPAYMPALGEPFPASEPDERIMEGPVNAFVVREDLGPFKDGSKIESLWVRFYFEHNRMFKLVNENGRHAIFRFIWFMERAETGYEEGHGWASHAIDPDVFAHMLWDAIEHDS